MIFCFQNTYLFIFHSRALAVAFGTVLPPSRLSEYLAVTVWLYVLLSNVKRDSVHALLSAEVMHPAMHCLIQMGFSALPLHFLPVKYSLLQSI